MRNNIWEKRILFITYTELLRPVEKFYYNNSGDTVYFIAGISYFYSKKINAQFIPLEKVKNELVKNKDWAIDNFDICITMEANIFCSIYIETLKAHAMLIDDLKIPVFVLGAGAQSSKDYSFDFIYEPNFKKSVELYLDAIFKSSGDICLRGEFTKQALAEIGYKNIFVSGCPSMYFCGRNLQINNKKISINDFKPMLNATRVEDLNSKIYIDFPNSIFLDQDIYFKALYCPLEVTNIGDFKFPFRKLYEQNRVDGDMNYYLWSKQIIEKDFNFSYGSRIHGNFIALQNKIPAFVKIIDSRTRELAEFFNIPNSTTICFNEKKENLFDLYLKVNYDKFNNEFSQKFDAFQNFLDKHDIPHVLSENHEFKEYIANLKYYDYRTDKSLLSKRVHLIKGLPKRDIFFISLINKCRHILDRCICK